MQVLREHKLVILASVIVGLFVGPSLVGAALADQTDEDGRADAAGRILVGTSARLMKNVDYFSFATPAEAIGVDYVGAVRFTDYTTGAYPAQVRYLDVFASLGVVYEQFEVYWVFTGTPQYAFAS